MAFSWRNNPVACQRCGIVNRFRMATTFCMRNINFSCFTRGVQFFRRPRRSLENAGQPDGRRDDLKRQTLHYCRSRRGAGGRGYWWQMGAAAVAATPRHRFAAATMGSTAARAVVRRALASNSPAPGCTKLCVESVRTSGPRGRDPLRPGRARSPIQRHRSGLAAH